MCPLQALGGYGGRGGTITEVISNALKLIYVSNGQTTMNTDFSLKRSINLRENSLKFLKCFCYNFLEFSRNVFICDQINVKFFQYSLKFS